MTVQDVPTIGLALLALLVALYALAAREQKTPYITSSVFGTVMLVLFAIVLSVAAKLIAKLFPVVSTGLAYFADVLLLAAVILVIFNVAKALNQRSYFRSDNFIKNLAPVRWVRSTWRSIRQEQRYQYNFAPFDDKLISCIKETKALGEPFSEAFKAAHRQEVPSWSMAYNVNTLNDADDILVSLAICFIKNGYSVQYASCTRHPIEFIIKLKTQVQAMNGDPLWEHSVKRIVAVDAYTPHFGFTDSVYDEETKKAKALGIRWVTAGSSYASLHAASAQAFNYIKVVERDRVRKPTLVVYDGPSALIDLESAEQYRIFLRHVIPSERLWGGMFTCIVECSLDPRNLAILRGYCDNFLDEVAQQP